jgi:murein DD-endopeptidase MepM/ murein hydrolase activator NlpD
VSPQGVTPSRVTPGSVARKTRRAAKHRLASRRTAPAREQIVGLTAALAAAAGAVGFSHAAVSPSQTEPVAVEAPIGDAQLDSITTARIERSRLASRDAHRAGLVEATERIRHAAAVRQAKARATKLAATRAQTQRRAAALATAKVAAQKAAAQKAAAQKAAAQKAAAEREAAEAKGTTEAAEGAGQSSSGATMMISGYRITATFGQGGGRWARNHTGTDFAAPTGTRIGAVMAGEVISAEYAGAYGNRVEVKHSDGTVTTYCHMSGFAVSVGDSVAAGDKVGEVGMTGNTTGPHLHFEVVEDGVQIDPMPWLEDHGLNP